MCSIFNVRGKGLYEGFEVVVDKFRNLLCRMAIARKDRASGVALFVDYREDVETTSLGIWELEVRYSNLSSSIKSSLCRRLRYSLTRSCILFFRLVDCFW